MELDLVTIYAVTAFVLLATGIVQLLSFVGGRFGRWLAWWGGSNLLIGLGTLMLARRRLESDANIVVLADLLTVTGYAMLFVGVRSFTMRPALIRSAIPAAVGIGVILSLSDPADFPVRIALLSILYGCWDGAVAFEALRLRRDEGLRTAWLMIFAFAPTAVLFFIRAAFAFTGYLGTGGVSAATNPTHALLAVSAAAFVMMRNMSLLMLAAERGQSSLLVRAQTDHLTGAYNRAGLLEQVERLSARMLTAAVLAIDIDHFKQLNDTYGHAAGDEMLRKVRSSAVDALRDGDLLGRWGGDEFVLLLPETEVGTALAIAKDVQARFAVATESMEITLSIGCAVGPLRDGDFLPILKQADEALYSSKRLGRNRITLAGSQQHQSALRSIDSDDVSRPAKVIYRS